MEAIELNLMLDQIKIENLDSMLSDLSTGQNKFNKEIFKVLLENSCYYPASGTDTSPIKYLEKIQSFIYCDYTYNEDKWTNEIIKEMDSYELIFKERLKVTKFFERHFFVKKHERIMEIESQTQAQHILINKLQRSEENESLIQEKYYEINRLQEELYDLKDRLTDNNLLKSILERTTSFSHITIWKKNEKYLSIIYISAEAVHCYEQIFLKNKITPKVISIIQPGHTLGGNWTNFFSSTSEFHNTISKGSIPDYMLLGCYGETDRYPPQISFDSSNFEEVPGSSKIFKSFNGESHYVFAVQKVKNLVV